MRADISGSYRLHGARSRSPAAGYHLGKVGTEELALAQVRVVASISIARSKFPKLLHSLREIRRIRTRPIFSRGSGARIATWRVDVGNSSGRSAAQQLLSAKPSKFNVRSTRSANATSTANYRIQFIGIDRSLTNKTVGIHWGKRQPNGEKPV
jgi:hypothetical protein